MPEYLVELYSITATPTRPPSPASATRSTVRYLRSILIPGDETCLHLVQADSVEQVAEAFEQVGLEADRIVEAVGCRRPRQSTTKGGSHDHQASRQASVCSWPSSLAGAFAVASSAGASFSPAAESST